MPTLAQPPSDLALFQRFTISELAERTGYSEVYLLNLRSGNKPISARFQRWMSRALGEPEAVLFAASEGSTT